MFIFIFLIAYNQNYINVVHHFISDSSIDKKYRETLKQNYRNYSKHNWHIPIKPEGIERASVSVN